MSRFHRLCAVLVVGGLIATQGGSLLANGGAVKIPLKYLSPVSNWGPIDASGLASVDVSDGEVIVTVAGLPKLGNDRYEGWLVSGIDMVSVGKFNTGANATGQYKIIMDRLPARRYDLFIISVEPEPDPGATADGRFSIGGYFTNLLPTPTRGAGVPVQPSATVQPGATVQPSATAQPVSSGAPNATPVVSGTPPAATLPSVLPATGEFVPDPAPPGLLLLALGATVAAALLTSRLRDHRDHGSKP